VPRKCRGERSADATAWPLADLESSGFFSLTPANQPLESVGNAFAEPINAGLRTLPGALLSSAMHATLRTTPGGQSPMTRLSAQTRQSSVVRGRAFPSHGRGRRFNPYSAHHPIHCFQRLRAPVTRHVSAPPDIGDPPPCAAEQGKIGTLNKAMGSVLNSPISTFEYPVLELVATALRHR